MKVDLTLSQHHLQESNELLDTIEHIARKTKIWMEITTLIVPGQNDSDLELKQIAEFLVNTCGADVPWHISRFYPQYKYADDPPIYQPTWLHLVSYSLPLLQYALDPRHPVHRGQRRGPGQTDMAMRF